VDTTDNLNLGSSWTNGVAPGTNDIVVWDFTVVGPNTTSLGAGLAWQRIQVASPGGLVTLNPGNTLTLLADAGDEIDMTAGANGP
jgi:hypothetical protein